MNREDIIRTAQEAGMVHDEDDDSFFSPSNLGMDVHINNLKRFAAIVAALEAKDEPVADHFDCGTYIGSHIGKEIRHSIGDDLPPQRTWVGLTDEEIDKAWRSVDYTVPWDQHRIDIAKAIEAKLKEKNT